jgi:uncharacterized DUF497 family protein
MEFELDQAKSDICFKEHGFDIAYVLQAVMDGERLLHKDLRWYYGEDCYQMLGAIEGRVFLLCIPFVEH